MIPTDPTSTLAASDFRNFRAAINHPNLALRADVRAEYEDRLKKLRKRDDGSLKYPKQPARDAAMTQFEGYQDSELGGIARVGNALQDTNPRIAIKKDYTNGVPPTLADVRNNKTRGVNVVVTPEGTVTHTDSNGDEIPDAHEYMHEIFDYILYEARDKLEEINVKLQEFSQTPNAVTKKAYADAVQAYNYFTGSFPAPDLAPGVPPSPFASAFSEIKFKPVVTNEGFIVSLRIQISWYNPRHSSSTIAIP